MSAPTPPPVPIVCALPFSYYAAPLISTFAYTYVFTMQSPNLIVIRQSFSTPSFNIIPFPIPDIVGGYFKVVANNTFDANNILAISKGVPTNIPMPLQYKKKYKKKFGIKIPYWVPYIPVSNIVKLFPYQIVKTKEKLISSPLTVPSFIFNMQVSMGVSDVNAQIDLSFDGLIPELVSTFINLFNLGNQINNNMSVSQIFIETLKVVPFTRLLIAITGGAIGGDVVPLYLIIKLSNIRFKLIFRFDNFLFQFGNIGFQFSNLGITTGVINIFDLISAAAPAAIKNCQFIIGAFPLIVKIPFEIPPSMLIPGLPIDPKLYDFIVKMIAQNNVTGAFTNILNIINSSADIQQYLNLVGISYETYVQYCPSVPPPANLFMCINIMLIFTDLFMAIVDLLRSDKLRDAMNITKYALMYIPNNIPMPSPIRVLIEQWNDKFNAINDLCKQSNSLILNTMADALEATINNTPLKDLSITFVFCAPLLA
jgi:hypothetical protein